MGTEIFECFYTDGLRPLLKTIEAKNMFERTLRYPRHLDRMRFLRDIGLLGNDSISTNDKQVVGRTILISILKKYVYRPDMKDRVTLAVYVESNDNSRSAYLEERFDEELSLSAMAKNNKFH